MKKKSIIIIVLTLLITAAVPNVSSECTYKNNIEIIENLNVNQVSFYNDVEIKIYGTLYMIKNKPLGQMLGLYGRFENIGSNPINAFFGIKIKTISTVPWDQTIMTEESMTLPSGSVAEMPCTATLGIGFFEVTYFMDGAADNEGFYIEKTAKGICFGFYQFVISGGYV